MNGNEKNGVPREISWNLLDLLRTMNSVYDAMPNRFERHEVLGEAIHDLCNVIKVDRFIYTEKIDPRYDNKGKISNFGYAFWVVEPDKPFEDISHLLSTEDFYNFKEAFKKNITDDKRITAKADMDWGDKVDKSMIKYLPEYFYLMSFEFSGSYLGSIIFGRNQNIPFSEEQISCVKMFATRLGTIVGIHFQQFSKLSNYIDFNEMLMLTTQGMCLAENGRFVDANPRFKEIFEYDNEKVFFKGTLMHWGIIDIKVARRNFVTHKRGKNRLYETEKWITVASGKEKFLHIQYYEFEYFDYLRQYFIISDDTEKQRRTMQLEKEAARLYGIQDMCIDMAYAFKMLPDGKLKYEWGSNSYFGMFAVQLHENPCNSPWDNVIYPDHRRLLEKKMRALRDNKSDIQEYMIRYKGLEMWIRDFTYPIYDSEKGVVTGIAGGVIDITARKLEQFQIEKAKIDLEQINKAKDDFISIIGHDIKNPLSGMRSLLQMLRDEVDTTSNEDAKEVVDTCIKTSDDLMKLFEDLMQWGKSKIGQSVINKTMNNIHDIVEQVKGQIDINLKQKNIELINIIPDSRLLLVDPDIMKTVFRNLISNAMKFSYPGGRIVVRENGDRELNGFPAVEFEVEDFGTGMKPEKCQKLFQLGVKVSDLGTHNEQGTGLGLILCKEFIERHGGTISVESEFGKGTKFKIVLPN